ncbi:hypothetical protein N657DRAFT_289731 [Parathielavia appendiculata]|uniref:Uncharacterized protein n=1 Tax=Parathielavia appendiculata TaxID=2587402 RepID=A0AAN6Z548_9PEZI|nr:hypothetical protein N657DRAFT_289731 [Parathielavia appendiculata]
MQYAVQPEGTPMSPGWIAGTAVGCALAVGALIGAGRCCLRWKRKHREQGQRGPNHHSAPFGFDPGSSELPTTTVSWLFRDSTPPEANNRKFGFLGGLNGNQRDRQDSLYINLRDVAEAARVKRSAAREAYPLEPIQAFSASDIPSTGQASQGEPLPGESSNSATNGTTTPAPVHAKPEHLSWDAVMHGALMPSSKALTTALPEHWLLPGGSSSNPGSSSGDGGGGATATTSAPSISYPPDEPPIFNAMSRHGRLPTWLDGPPRRSRRPAAQPAPAPAPTPPDPPLRDHYLRPPPRPAPATSSKEQRRQQKAIARQQRIMARPRAAYEYQGGNMVFGEPL